MFWFRIETPHPAETSAKAREVMTAALQRQGSTMPFAEMVRQKLPSWFITSFAPPRTAEENREYVERWRTLTPEEQDQVEREQRWSAEEWFDWMQPAQRSWSWWDMESRGDGQLLLAVTSPEWPFAWGALRWLFVAAGATGMTPEWEGDWAEALGLI
jgi:hypothetical protein